MILGVSTATFLQIHVALSLIGIATGLVAVLAMIRGKLLRVWTAVFLATTVLTSATGFPLPPFGLDPARIVGIVSLVVLALALAALHVFRLAGAWRWVYVVTATIALYFNCFVAVVQTFQKIELFRALAPTQQEPPFAIAQLVVLALFVALGVLGVRSFRPAGAQ